MTAISQQLFIAVRGFLVLMGTEDEGELVLFDPGIRASLRSYGETNKFGKNKIAFSAIIGTQQCDQENFVSQSVTKSVLSYFNVHSKDSAFKNGTQEKLDCLAFNRNGSLCLGGSLNGNLFVWSSFTGEMLCKLKVSIGAVKKVHIDREDLRVLLLTSDNKLMTYDFDLMKHLIARGQLDTANLKPLVSVAPHKKPIIDMVIAEGDESIAITLSQDNTVKITDMLTGNSLSEVFLEDAPSCFCTDFLGTTVFVGFADGKIRKYNYLRNSLDLTFETDKEVNSQQIAKVEPQEEKSLFEVRHKGRVTSIIYVPEMKELMSSGIDDMLFMFTTSGVTTFSTGKFKKSFDFMQLIQRPVSFYVSTHFGTNTTKSKMLVKPFNKTTIDHIAGDSLIRSFIPISKKEETTEEDSLNKKKLAKAVSSGLLDIFESCLQERASFSNGSGKAPLLRKREIQELEDENSELKQRLLTLANMNKLLMKKVKREQVE